MNARTNVPSTNERLGMTWWNNCTPAERTHLMQQVEEIIGPFDVSAARCWEFWQRGEIRLRRFSARQILRR